MKKLLASTLALVLVLSMAVSAAALSSAVDEIRFDGKYVFDISLEDLIAATASTGVEDPVKDVFGKDEFNCKITLGSSYVKSSIKEYDDYVLTEEDKAILEGLVEDSEEYKAALKIAMENATYGKGLRVTFTPVEDYTVADHEVRYEYYFLRSASGHVRKTEPVKNKFMIVREDITKGSIETMANEDFPTQLMETTDIISADRFAEAKGKSIGITDYNETWRLWIKNVSDAQKGINVHFDNLIDDKVSESFKDVKFQALNFLSEEAYMATRVNLEVDVDADALKLKGPDQKVWLYSFDGKTLVLQDVYTVNVYENELTVSFEIPGKTVLGSYYISDTELEIKDVPEKDEKPETENPNTGANDVVGMAAALAVVSLVAAAAVAFKAGK